MTWILLLTFLLFSYSWAQRLPANPDSTIAARNVLQFLYELRTNNQILLGQNLGHGTAIVSGYDKYIENLKLKVGKYLGFIGGDYGLDPNHNIQESNQVFIDHWRRGGIITLSWHFDNPWTGGDSWDTNQQENLFELLNVSDCNIPCQKWNLQKQNIANALESFREENVPILWRPLHEMNGDWFWWGRKQKKSQLDHERAYIELWRDMFDFLTKTRKFNNLIWVYSVASTRDRLLTSYFPGASYVDVVGIDIYGDDVQTYFSQRDYADLQSLGDFPLGLTEFGPTLSSANGHYDYRRLLTSLDNHWPQFCFSLSWSNWHEESREVKVAFVSNMFLSQTLGRADVVTLDKMDFATHNSLPTKVLSHQQFKIPNLKPTSKPSKSKPAASNSTIKTANPKATDAARRVLKYLSGLSKRNVILLGQDLGVGSTIVSGYDKYVSKLHTQTQKWLGLIGGDYGLDVNHDPATSARVFINHHKRGGIVTISWTMDNPWTGEDAWDTNQEENLWELIDYENCNYACEKWSEQKRAAAAALRPLRDAGVPVLWRPLHEMNGYWFWWCQKTWPGHEQAYIAVWKDMFDYLTREEGLNNLLWVYSTATSYDALLKNYYPGPDYVDVVGIDVYNDDVLSFFTERDRKDLINLGNHPVGLTEFGPTLESARGSYDYRRLLDGMNVHWPGFCFSYSWHNWIEDGEEVKISYSTNLGVKDVFSRSQVITLDEIDMDSPNVQQPTRKPTRKPTSLQLPTIKPNQSNQVRIKNRWSNLYLTLVDATNGSLPRLRPLNTGTPSQRWVVEQAGDSSFPMHLRIKCKWKNAFYLNAVADENSADVVAWKFKKEWWSMRWSINPLDAGHFQIINTWGNRCLTTRLDPESQDEWTFVEVYECNTDWWSQHWTLEKI